MTKKRGIHRCDCEDCNRNREIGCSGFTHLGENGLWHGWKDGAGPCRHATTVEESNEIARLVQGFDRERNYAKESWKRRESHRRRQDYLMRREKHLTCQECGGEGGYLEPHGLDYGGEWIDCAWCLGTGEVTPHERGIWLAERAQAKREEAAK